VLVSPTLKSFKHGVFIAPIYPLFADSFRVKAQEPFMPFPHKDSGVSSPTPLTPYPTLIYHVEIITLYMTKRVEDLERLDSLLAESLSI
jgi:hypothetical protein